jgi:hypothetical protein
MSTKLARRLFFLYPTGAEPSPSKDNRGNSMRSSALIAPPLPPPSFPGEPLSATRCSGAELARASLMSVLALNSITCSSPLTSFYWSSCGASDTNSVSATSQRCSSRGDSNSTRKHYAINAVREWEVRFAPLITQQLRRSRRGKAGKSWLCWLLLSSVPDTGI